jgi:hypothetical protein
VKSSGQHRYDSGDEKQQYPDQKMELRFLPAMSVWYSVEPQQALIRLIRSSLS